MNAGTNLLLILSLLFALAVGGATISERRNEEADTTTPSRIAINHNETMLSVAGAAYGWSDLLADLQAFFSTPRGGGCGEWVCGNNHNETMLSVAGAAYGWSDLLADMKAVFSSPGGGGAGCGEWICGGNHNETMLGSSLAIGRAYTLTDLLTSIQTFFVSKPTSGCEDEFGCGMNHNETMLRDTAPVQAASRWDHWPASLAALFSTRPTPGGCDEWYCGSNHNETFLSRAHR